ncbi:hypothetical protein [Polaribacter cellanae]|uniref:Uncharacterized protein n=1 Tax=Polaribacter cellanae TaxID=2818493 RepID=A0A975H8S8_9FLAO|nr:hypothetical protein [Polaribacter cellanae]QTE21990.1 hypothetical protein J3359_14395 [Polaribacter cellanae]
MIFDILQILTFNEGKQEQGYNVFYLYKDYIETQIDKEVFYNKNICNLITQYDLLNKGYPFIMTPEMSHILLYKKKSIKENFSLVEKLIYAEVAKETKKVLNPEFKDLWTSDGSFFISYDNEKKDFFIYESPLLLNKIPIDFLSPFSSLMNNEEMGEKDSLQIQNYDHEEFESIIQKLEVSISPLKGTCQNVLDFIQKFTLTIIPKKHKENYFSSGSNGLYIGRTVLSNLHITSKELIVEALVHEAVHSYLYMIEVLKPWMPDFESSRKFGNQVASFWTGNLISVRSFTQAVFIWYSLYNFWKICKDKSLYDEGFINNRLNFITKGFERLKLNEIEKMTSIVFPIETKNTILAIQDKILNSYQIENETFKR